MQKNPVISYYRDMDAYDRALKLLSMREHTEKELRKKLSDKGYQKAEIDDAVGRLIAEGSLSEKRFAEAYIRSRLRKSPEGKEMLRLRLREKGTPADIAAEALNEAWENEDYVKPLSQYAESLLRKKGESGTVAALLRKGFRNSEIKAALSLLDRDIGE